MQPLRSPSTQEGYKRQIAIDRSSGDCVLCKRQALQSFKYWKIVENKFPYDLIAKTNHILVSNRHVDGTALNEEELRELTELKAVALLRTYDYLIENFPKTQSFPDHFHLQLIVGK